MADRYGIGDAIACTASEKIYWFFGAAEPAKGHPTRGTFKKNGCAEVLRRKVFAPGSPPTTPDRIVCEVAKYSCQKFHEEKQQTECGSHRAWQGYLVGPAKCTIHIPLKTMPKKPASR